MNTARRQRHSVRALPFPLLLTLALAPNTSVGQQPTEPVPVVTNASVPLYPRIALIAHIMGVVRFRLSTDGSHVTSVEVENGPPLLAKAAEENIKTWQFERHKPTTFEATFTYKLLPATCDAKGNCNGVENDEVLLHLPTNVEIAAREAVLD
jgi:Gram-negative bacterial TonB protein C-terminal